MDWIVTLIVGAFIGWLASVLMRTSAATGPLLDIVVGVIGAALGRWFFGGILGFQSAETAGTLSAAGILWGVLGAVLLLAIIKAATAIGRPARP